MNEKKEDLSNGELVRLLEAADSAANKNYLMTCSNSEVQKFKDYIVDEESGVTKSLEQVSLFRLSRLIYGADENLTEKLKSFFLTFSGLQFNPSVFYVIQNRKVKTGKADDGSQNEYAFSFYIGIKPYGLNHTDTEASIAGNMLKETFSGVFLGSSIKEACYDEKAKIRNIAMGGGNVDVVCVSAQPSAKKDSDEKSVEQGLEYFIDVMRNRPYTAVLLATPVDEMAVQLRKREFENLYSKLSAFQRVTIAFGKNESNAISESLSNSTTVTESNGDSFTTTNSRSTTISEGGSSGYSLSSSSGAGSSSSSSSTTWGKSETFGVSQSMGTTHNIAISDGTVIIKGDTKTAGSSLTNTIEVQNKGVEGLLEQLDENLKKIKYGESYGLWECAAYFMSKSYEESMFAANTYKSLILGDDSTSERCHLIHWEKPSDDASRSKQMNLCNGILSGEHPIIQTRDKIFRNVIPSTVVNGRDLAYFMRLPQKSISGLAVDTIAAFERSVVSKSGTGVNENSVIVDFGRVCHMDKEEIPISLDLNEFTKHCFVTGSTGSGKSTTTELLLQRCIEKKINFLVLEPAKGEYKKALKNVEEINIFTTHPLCESLLHINPFKFEEGIHVLEHIDRLLGIFSSCWELTAAMPAILKKGVERAYQSVGWDLVNSYYIGDKKPYEYPTFSTLVGELRKVIESSEYSAEAKGNYTGALVTRVESLTAGVLKQIFCNEYYTDPEVLFKGKTVVDLSRLGSAETKTLIMGVLVMQLSEYRQVTTVGTNKKIHHLTVIEEAHNLLRNTQDAGAGGSDLIRKSVEMMSNAIAEMRTYGEGFLIVDQSPTAVDISAIKNTNTKIVMRLPEQHDCETIAKAMGLDEFQTKEITKFPQGVAVVMQNNWSAAVLTKVEKISPPSGEEEWTDAEFNRKLRAELALLCGIIGWGRGSFFSSNKNEKIAQDEFEKLPTFADIEKKIDEVKHKHYKKLVGERRWNEIQTSEAYKGKDVSQYPEPARIAELKKLVDFYEKEYGLGNEKESSKNYKGFGRLAVALLGCEDVWRVLLNYSRCLRTKNTFRSILQKYIECVSASDENFERFFKCMLKVFNAPFIVKTCGSKEEGVAFVDCMKSAGENWNQILKKRG